MALYTLIHKDKYVIHHVWKESWWRHQMETFSELLALYEGIQLSPLDSSHKSQWRGALMFSLICHFGRSHSVVSVVIGATDKCPCVWRLYISDKNHVWWAPLPDILCIIHVYLMRNGLEFLLLCIGESIAGWVGITRIPPHINRQCTWGQFYLSYIGGLILGLCPANERRCYFVTTSRIGWAQT